MIGWITGRRADFAALEPEGCEKPTFPDIEPLLADAEVAGTRFEESRLR